uniref:Cilia- and flagella-associated protein 206 n=1 Tax=Salarias fasciatus TaxID=181472 RepID=A0A672GDE8_SALFA
MSRLEGEKLIRLIIADVVRECAVRGHGVSDSLAAFMVKAVVLDPRNGFNVDRTLTKQDVQKLEELCLDKLLKKCSPSLDTIKMQVYFNMTYTSRRGFLEEAERAGRSTLSALRRGITESRVNSREQLQAAYRDMVRYTLLQSGLGSASDPRAVQEATAALQSIFPQSKLGVFMVLSRREKEQQLDELSRTVTGIRLFNQASVKGEAVQVCSHESLVSPRVPDERVDPAEMKMRDEDEWLWPEAADFSRLPLQYSGFCGFTLVDRDGLLLPGTLLLLTHLSVPEAWSRLGSSAL